MPKEQLFLDEFTEFHKTQLSTTNLGNAKPLELVGSWNGGWSLDLHSTRSLKRLNEYGWDTDRTKIGQALYDLKYQNKQKNICFLASEAVSFLWYVGIVAHLDVLIPVPSSRERKFQPVYELAKVIGNEISLKVDFKTVFKKSSLEIKNTSPMHKKNILEESIVVKSKKNIGRNVLLFDDLYSTGSTLEVITRKLKEENRVKNVYVLTLTKTRTRQ